jgi:hypothetical protein
MAWWILFVTGGLLCGVWWTAVPRFLWFFRHHRLSKQAAVLSPLSCWPLVSVVVPARNEAAKVEGCLRSLLGLNYPALEILAVNDRSTDHTGAILERLAQANAGLSVIHITELPEQWLGKNYAMFTAARMARGAYILFTDADVMFTQETLQFAMRYVIHQKLDHLCLHPQMIPGSYWENTMTMLFSLLFVAGTKPWALSTKARKSYAGIGAFNLIRTTSYNQIGGHAALRLEVTDDVKLGKLVQSAGLRQDMLMADDLLKVKWQEGGVSGVIKGLEKNGYAGLDYSLGTLSLVTLHLLLAFLLPYIGLVLLHDIGGIGYALVLGTMHGMFGYLGARSGVGWHISLGLPAAALLFLWALWRSALLTLWHGGIWWRDTFYPLAMLRTHGGRRADD